MSQPIKVLLSLFLIFSGSSAYASNWFVLSPTIDGGTESVDLSSIVAKGNYVTAWFMNTSPVEQKFERSFPTVRTDKPYKSIKVHQVINCSKRESATEHIAYYTDENGGGTYLGSIVAQPSQYTFSSIIPDTLGEQRLDYVCKYNIPRKFKPAT